AELVFARNEHFQYVDRVQPVPGFAEWRIRTRIVRSPARSGDLVHDGVDSLDDRIVRHEVGSRCNALSRISIQALRSVRPLASLGNSGVISIRRGWAHGGIERTRTSRRSITRSGSDVSTRTPSTGPVGVSSGTTATSRTPA